MRVLIIGLNYLPESVSIGPYTSDLAEYLRQRGHYIQVITSFPHAPQWRIWDGYKGRCFMREIIDEIPVLRTYVYVPKRPRRALNRILYDMSFTISAFLGALTTGSCDVLVIISPPLQLGLTGWALGILKRAPFLFHIQDLVPDAAVATGMLSEKSWAVRLARKLEHFVYGKAHKIGAICGGFERNLLSKGVPSEKIALLPNYIDLEFMHSVERNNNFRQKHGLREEDFVVMYSGSVALKQGLDTFVKAAASLRDQPGLVFLLIGEGPYMFELHELGDQLRASNLRFLPMQPRETLPSQLSAADALVITQRKAITDVVFPGKLLYYMAAARPILAAVSPDSETGRFVRDNKIGIVVPPEEPLALAQAVLELRRIGGAGMGKNARQVVESHFDRQIVLRTFAEQIEALAVTDAGNGQHSSPAGLSD